jgi:hypothetical protein
MTAPFHADAGNGRSKACQRLRIDWNSTRCAEMLQQKSHIQSSSVGLSFQSHLSEPLTGARFPRSCARRAHPRPRVGVNDESRDQDNDVMVEDCDNLERAMPDVVILQPRGDGEAMGIVKPGGGRPWARDCW